MGHHAWLSLLIGAASIGATEVVHQWSLPAMQLTFLNGINIQDIGEIIKWGIQAVIGYYTIKNLKKKS